MQANAGEYGRRFIQMIVVSNIILFLVQIKKYTFFLLLMHIFNKEKKKLQWVGQLNVASLFEIFRNLIQRIINLNFVKKYN